MARQWHVDFTYVTPEFDDVEMYRHNNHEIILTRSLESADPGNWDAYIRVSANGGEFGNSRPLSGRLTNSLVAVVTQARAK